MKEASRRRKKDSGIEQTKKKDKDELEVNVEAKRHFKKNAKKGLQAMPPSPHTPATGQAAPTEPPTPPAVAAAIAHAVSPVKAKKKKAKAHAEEKAEKTDEPPTPPAVAAAITQALSPKKAKVKKIDESRISQAKEKVKKTDEPPTPPAVIAAIAQAKEKAKQTDESPTPPVVTAATAQGKGKAKRTEEPLTPPVATPPAVSAAISQAGLDVGKTKNTPEIVVAKEKVRKTVEPPTPPEVVAAIAEAKEKTKKKSKELVEVDGQEKPKKKFKEEPPTPLTPRTPPLTPITPPVEEEKPSSKKKVKQSKEESWSPLTPPVDEDFKELKKPRKGSMEIVREGGKTKKIAFSPGRTIALVEDLDRGISTFAESTRNWYHLHFPELAKIVTDDILYAKVARCIGVRSSFDRKGRLDELVTACGGDKEVADQVVKAMQSSEGQDIGDMDMLSVDTFTSQVVRLAKVRPSIVKYFKTNMKLVAPNLCTLLGATETAHLISEAGSLANLAKQPASAVRILGTPKGQVTLFDELKAKSGSTAKYGLMLNSTFLDSAQAKNKRRIAQYLASKCKIAARMDCFLRADCFSKRLRTQMEKRLRSDGSKAAKVANKGLEKGEALHHLQTRGWKALFEEPHGGRLQYFISDLFALICFMMVVFGLLKLHSLNKQKPGSRDPLIYV